MRIASALVVILAAAPAAAVPLFIPHHGRLRDGNDAPVGGTHKFTFRIYSPAPTGQPPVKLWEESYTVPVTDGLYTVLIGDPLAGEGHTVLDLDDFAVDEDRFLGLQIDTDAEMTPLLRIGSTIFALKAGDAETLGGEAPEFYASQADLAAAAAALETFKTDGGTTYFKKAGGTVSGDLAVTGAATVSGAATTGALTAASAGVTGALSAGSAGVTGALTAGSANVTGALSAGSASVTGAFDAGAATLASGAVAGDLTVGGNLGVGNTSPAYKLDVNGIVNASDIYKGGAPFNPSQWTSGGSGAISYSGGNVGIGTTTPARIIQTRTGINQYSYSQSDGTIELATYINGGFNSGMIGTVSNHPFQIYTSNSGPVMTLTPGGSSGGSVGIGTTNPATKLDVTGEVRVGTSAVGCGGGNAGAIRYASGQFFGCDGTSWRPFFPQTIVIQSGARRWSDASYAKSCAEYLSPPGGYLYSGAIGDGVYAIDPDGPSGAAAFNVWCDMTNDGGGWTLLMRFKSDSVLTYNAAYWTNTTNLNEDPGGSVDPSVNANAKLASFNTVTGASLRGCKQGATPCVIQAFTGSMTAFTAFTGARQAGNIARSTLVSLFGDDSTQPYCNQSGINNDIVAGGARFGLSGNNENDCASSDSGWGWGTFSCSAKGSGCGAGLSRWNSGTCNSTCVQGHLWVK